MSIFSTILKALISIFIDQAKQQFKKLPQDQQDKLIQVSKMVQIIKLGKEQGLTIKQIITQLTNQTGLTFENLTAWIVEYWAQKGQQVGSLDEGISLILADASQRTETGLKSLWSGISNLVSSVVTNVDWEAVVMGLGQFVYNTYVKGKVRI